MIKSANDLNRLATERAAAASPLTVRTALLVPEFPYNEIRVPQNSNQTVGQSVLSVSINPYLLRRKIYTYFYYNGASASVFLGTVRIQRLGRDILTFPVALSNNGGTLTTPPSRPFISSTGGNPVPDSITLTPNSPLPNEAASVIVHPQIMDAEIDTIQLDVQGYAGDAGYRAWFGVLSSDIAR